MNEWMLFYLHYVYNFVNWYYSLRDVHSGIMEYALYVQLAVKQL